MRGSSRRWYPKAELLLARGSALPAVPVWDKCPKHFPQPGLPPLTRSLRLSHRCWSVPGAGERAAVLRRSARALHHSTEHSLCTSKRAWELSPV